jgi:hypothetical protein
MIEVQSSEREQRIFVEFRRKMRSADVLSGSMERLLQDIHFTGQVNLILQNGRVLKSGYQESYFRQHESEIATRAQ